TVSENGIISLMAGDKHLATVFPEDARAAGMDSNALAQEWAKAFEGAITEYRGQRSWKRRAQSVAFALLTLAGMVAILFAIRKFTARLTTFCVQRFESRIAADDRKVISVVARSRVLPAIKTACSAIRLVLSLIVVFFGLQLLLFYFPRTKVAAIGLFGSVW